MTQLLILMQISLLLIRLKLNKKITGKISDNGTNDIEIIVPLKHLRIFWRTLEMSLTNCETSLDLN